MIQRTTYTKTKNDTMDDFDFEEYLMNAMLSVLVCIAVLVTLIALCTSCTTTRYVQVPVTVHDTLRQTALRTDTLRLHDKEYINVYTRGDTVYKDRLVYRDRNHISTLHDTTYIHRTDTVSVPMPVERRATWWEKACAWAGERLFAAIALVLVAIVAVWLIHRKK